MKDEMNKNEGLSNYVVVPRKVASDYRERKITRQERDVYVWLRMISSPYGIAIVELQAIASDCFGIGTSPNYANKVMLSLKRKRYIYYSNRSGCRGSFEVELGDWPLPRNKDGPISVKRLDKYFDTSSEVRGADTGTTPAQSEVSTELLSQSQRSESAENDLNAVFDEFPEKTTVRGTDNDNEPDNEKENDTYRLNGPFKNKIPIKDFVPKSHKDEVCLNIARELGEVYMDFILGSRKKHGFLKIEQVWKYCQGADKFHTADNKAAFFNSLLQKQSLRGVDKIQA